MPLNKNSSNIAHDSNTFRSQKNSFVAAITVNQEFDEMFDMRILDILIYIGVTMEGTAQTGHHSLTQFYGNYANRSKCKAAFHC